MRESTFTSKLKGHLRQSIYCLKINASYARGVPDCYYSGSYRGLWTEHKYFNKLPPIIDLTKTKITSSLQQLWLTQRHAEGRSVGMIVGSTKGHLFLPGLDWQRPFSREEFILRAKTYDQLATEIIDYCGAMEDVPLP